jgi:regulator of protease activity HflC (stomatin/prohibitin superfamily)
MLPEIPMLLVALVVSGIAILALLGASFFTVEQRTAAIVQRLGKFMREAGPGIQVKIPLVDRVVGRVNLRVQQLDVEIETKTEDNVFVRMVVAVQYYVLPEKVYDAYYKLDDARRQITSFVFDVVRAQVPKIPLDDVFEKKDDIANIVKSELAQVMEDFGYGILKALVTDIDPDPKVKESMNEINAAQRMRVAATERGEADRILRVKAAEGDAQSKALQGRGIADQRQAIVAGLRDSVDEFRKSVPGTTAKDVMNLVLMTQYFDMLKEIGASSRTNAILIPHSPGNLTTLTEQMRNAMMEADQTVRASNAVPATASTAVDESRVMYGPSRESAPSPPANAGRADAAAPTREAHHG